MAQRGMLERLIGAAFFDINTYEEVEADASLTGQAAAVVFLTAIADAIGSSGAGPFGAVFSGASDVFGWFVWAAATYVIGTKVFGGTASWGELLRTLGFAHAPGFLLILGIIPLLGWGVQAVVALWMLALGVIAVRQALDFSTQKALATVFLGWVALAILHALF